MAHTIYMDKMILKQLAIFHMSLIATRRMRYFGVLHALTITLAWSLADYGSLNNSIAVACSTESIMKDKIIDKYDRGNILSNISRNDIHHI